MEEFLRVSSFNCRNIKSSIDNVRQLCDTNDIIFLQETWLTFEELPMLKSLHADFYADGVTAMDTSSGLLLGRPGAKTINVFQACLGAQLTICAQK